MILLAEKPLGIHGVKLTDVQLTDSPATHIDTKSLESAYNIVCGNAVTVVVMSLALTLKTNKTVKAKNPLSLENLSLSDSALQKARKYELLDPDVRLMMKVRNGDAAAFEQLVEKYQHRLISILEYQVPSRGQAEDLAQEVFMRIYRARERYVPAAKFSTWMFTITNNVAYNAIRKLSRRKEVNLINSPSGKVGVRPLDSMAKDKSGLMPTRQTARKEIKEIVGQAVQSLNDRQRMAMLLKYFEDMSYIEIAEAMELTTQAVKSLSVSYTHLTLPTTPYV